MWHDHIDSADETKQLEFTAATEKMNRVYASKPVPSRTGLGL
jgi:hypothetical protein